MVLKACVSGKPRGKHDFPVVSRAMMDKTTLGPSLRFRAALLAAEAKLFAAVAVASLNCCESNECADELAVLDRRRFIG